MTNPGAAGDQHYSPTVKIAPEQRAFWASQLAKIADGTFPHPLASIPNSLRAEVRRSRLVLTAALHHAAGKNVKMRAENGRVPNEAQSLRKFAATAQGVDDLLARCKAAAAETN